ncbi:signal peptidase I [uncultured Gemmiger sp.]|uniref:signal peptidase I n=1 Tax=uncultured Gemmiger sp. TaxID=1623490 RepID=UPI0025F91FAB|nr:signal peptidase I [uncultured Gemmiger sp.]
MNRTKSNYGLLEWIDSLVFAAVALALVFTFGVRIVQVDGSSMNPGLVNGERLLLSSLPYEPEYGDVVVIDSYTNYGKLLIKRVIGKEGDVINIDFDTGVVYRNGEPLDEPYTAEPTYLYEGVDFPLTVPDGMLFIMGDNRNNSKDSRSPEIGFVSEGDVLGKAVLRLTPFDKFGLIS